ncbi:kinetochore-associated Ndc80 complex subunit spc25 [Tilletia horrida]|nr:kinetochore-associated Ndc80 complex subunit spc25 [Tilletia horrida]
MSARRSSNFTPLPPQPPLPGGGAGIAATPRRTPARNLGYTPASTSINPDLSFLKPQVPGAAAATAVSSSAAAAQQPPQPIVTVRLSRVASDLYHPSLDFASFHARIRNFTTAFDAYVSDQLLLTEQDKTDARTEQSERQDKLRAARRELDQQTRLQRELWDTVNDERAQDKRLRAALAMLTSQHAALSDQLTDAAAERAEAQSRLETRRRAKQAQRDQLAAQRAQDGPELAALQRLLGCRIERRSSTRGVPHTVMTTGGEYVRFSFGLLARSKLTSPLQQGPGSRGMDEQDDEAWFVLDVSKPNYEVPEHFPPLPPTTLANLLADLNSSRALYAFVKQMREALREETERGAL